MLRASLRLAQAPHLAAQTVARVPKYASLLFRGNLRHLDNHLLGSAADASLIKRTRMFMEQPWLCQPLVHAAELAARKENGTQFAHYWFYKLEFVLWSLDGDSDPRWKNFRFTAKNSVEHVSPQTRSKLDDVWVEGQLHHFGNLALVSRSINSEFSNNPFTVKRAQFESKNKDAVDSLKLDLIYKTERGWDDAAASAHKEAMIERFDTYFRRCERPTGPKQSQ